ncbi:MAG: radical SAM protein [Candidatus Marinimicrobia bacterium]|nr:radical SAM protein [Candidatus Neomarinimicrobiota bacterium]
MKVIAKTGTDKLATVYVAQSDTGKLLEFVESVPSPFSIEEKWVLIISTLYGCPIKCKFCDAGNFYNGRPTKDELLFQIDYLIKNRFGDISVPSKKFKIQFSRMGEPSFNPAVLEALKEIPSRYDAPGFYPSLSTIAPNGTDEFFEGLLQMKNKYYKNKFQFQFSIHSTDLNQRNWLIPVKTWSFDKMARFGEKFHKGSNQKTTLNFALADKSIVEQDVLLKYFNPDDFLIKITPVNPTYNAQKNNLDSSISKSSKQNIIINNLKNAGYEVILSIGDLTENEIGSNCGQHVMNYLDNNVKLKNSYTFPIQKYLI